VLWSGHAEGVLVLSYSSWFLSATRAEREEGSGATCGCRDGSRVHAWGEAKADGGRTTVGLCPEAGPRFGSLGLGFPSGRVAGAERPGANASVI
jgi:hypothetical protein